MASINQLFKRTMKTSTRGTLTKAVKDFAAILTSDDSESFIQYLNAHLSDILSVNNYSGINVVATFEVSASMSSVIDEITFQDNWGWVAETARQWEEQLKLWVSCPADLRIVRDSYDKEFQVPLEVTHKCIYLMRYLSLVCAEDYFDNDLNNDLFSYLVILISTADVWRNMNHENE